MHKRSQRGFFKFLVAAACGAGIMVAATSCRHRCRHDPEKAHKFVTWFVDDKLDDLDATDEQRKAIHASKDRIFEQVKAVHSDRDKIHAELLAEWQKEQPDAERVRAIVDERIDAMRAVAHKAVDEVIAAHGVLTPEQRAALAEEIKERLDDH